MTRCSVPLCSNTANHNFPKNAKVRKRWLRAIRRTDLDPKTGAKICRKHFQDSDYLKISKHTGLKLQRRFLKKSAVPSIFEWTVKSGNSKVTRDKHRTGCKHRRHVAQDVVSTCTRCNNIHPTQKHQRNIIKNVSHKVDLSPHRTSRSPVKGYSPKVKKVSQNTQTCNNLRLFTTNQLLSDDESVCFYTGLDTYAQFTHLLSTLLPMAHDIKYRPSWITSLTVEDQFLMLLIKLRRIKPDFEIGKMFGVNKNDVSDVIVTWVSFVCDHWKHLEFWPSDSQINTYIPEAFKQHRPSNEVISTKTPITKESQCNDQKVYFSQYKFDNRPTLLFRCCTEGLVTYLSDFGDSDVSVNIYQKIEKSQMSDVSMNIDQNEDENVPMERLTGATKVYKILGYAPNLSYAPLSSKIFAICVMICRFKECIDNKDEL